MGFQLAGIALGVLSTLCLVYGLNKDKLIATVVGTVGIFAGLVLMVAF